MSIALFYVFVFRSLLATLDAMMKRTRSMLLLLPDVVIDEVKEIRTEVQKLANVSAE